MNESCYKLQQSWTIDWVVVRPGGMPVLAWACSTFVRPRRLKPAARETFAYPYRLKSQKRRGVPAARGCYRIAQGDMGNCTEYNKGVFGARYLLQFSWCESPFSHPLISCVEEEISTQRSRAMPRNKERRYVKITMIIGTNRDKALNFYPLMENHLNPPTRVLPPAPLSDDALS